MNFLAKVKLSNNYDMVVGDLYLEDGTTPISDVDGTTALLTTNGTSWELLDSSWVQIDLTVDQIINTNFYPFLMSICNSIQNNFIIGQLSQVYESATISEIDAGYVISGLPSPPLVQTNDYVSVVNYIRKFPEASAVQPKYCWENQQYLAENLYGITLPDYPIEVLSSSLSSVISTDTDSITIDKSGVDMRITSSASVFGVFYASFPADFINTVISMFGYDLFDRGNKEKRQERLGNYTYTNFEPTQYYGNGSYPLVMENKIKFWQRIYL